MIVIVDNNEYTLTDICDIGIIQLATEDTNEDRLVLPPSKIETVTTYVFEAYTKYYNAHLVEEINSIPTPLDGEKVSVFEHMELQQFSDKELVELIKYSQYLVCEPL